MEDNKVYVIFYNNRRYKSSSLNDLNAIFNNVFDKISTKLRCLCRIKQPFVVSVATSKERAEYIIDLHMSFSGDVRSEYWLEQQYLNE